MTGRLAQCPPATEPLVGLAPWLHLRCRESHCASGTMAEGAATEPKAVATATPEPDTWPPLALCSLA